ncbi:MAG TPA: DUF3108 domain-containing protein [Lutibacter sp.]|nr:DUF3108 domain-containing protein [Lutibacter sp.]
MKNIFIILFLLIFSFKGDAQEANLVSEYTTKESKTTSYSEGEWLKFRVHYGIFNAGYATLKLKQSEIDGQKLYHAVGKGWTVGAAKLFYNIEDEYESHFTKDKLVKPIKFKRRVDEGGYIIKRDMYFNHVRKTVKIDDLKNKEKTEMSIGDVQDLVSSFYHLRNYNLDTIKVGDEIQINLFFDKENYPFKLKFLKKEILKTKFGKIKTWKIRPLVQKGRVFEGQESLTIWISNDENKIPLRIKASLAVGSLKVDLQEYKGLAAPFSKVE